MTSTETRPTWSERWNPRNWTLVWKLVAIGVVPALLALVLGVLRVADQAGAAADLGLSSKLLEVRGQVAGVADALRQERDEATLFVAGGRTGDRGVLEIGSAQTDAEVETMLAAVRATEQLDAGAVAARQQAEAGLARLRSIRADSVSSATVTSAQVRGLYTDIIGGVDVLDRAMLRQLRVPDTAGLADALTAASGAAEQLALQHTVIGAVLRAGKLTPDDVTVVSSTETQLLEAYRDYQLALTPGQLARMGNFLDDPGNGQRETLRASIMGSPGNQSVNKQQPLDWDAAYAGARAAVDKSSGLVRQELAASSTAAEQRASNLAGVNSVVLMLGLLLGLTMALLIARALVRSLRVLRTAALDVAERRLPQAVESMRAGETPDSTVDPVPLTNRDEVGQVARAFDAVHGQALRLASDQAALQSNVSAMFVNLSRRSQALVERQLQLIEQLESNEQDSDQLANLFQLDHLATRMRRNSENLLVLAGTDLAKRNSAPVPVVDVLRAAVSEIEQYQRIVVQAPPAAAIVGRAASDIVHLLAELLDNSTNFSPPDSQVVMSTTRTADGSMVVEIADRGVGMAEHELSDANHRLSGPSSVDVSASRRMGLFVVGRLGIRHGIDVRLSTSDVGGPGGGLTASVTVPSYLIASDEEKGANRQAPSRVGAAGAPLEILQQRSSSDRNGYLGNSSLSSLVAGTDGPANPAGVFDTASAEDHLFAQPPTANGGNPPALPSRRPGSSLRPDGPAGPPASGGPARPDPGEQADADQQAARAAERREVAEQARRDQEAAERAAKERAAKQQAAKDQAAKTRPAQEQAGPDRPAPGAGLSLRGFTPHPPGNGGGNGNGRTLGRLFGTGAGAPSGAAAHEPQAVAPEAVPATEGASAEAPQITAPEQDVTGDRSPADVRTGAAAADVTAADEAPADVEEAAPVAEADAGEQGPRTTAFPLIAGPTSMPALRPNPAPRPTQAEPANPRPRPVLPQRLPRIPAVPSGTDAATPPAPPVPPAPHTTPMPIVGPEPQPAPALPEQPAAVRPQPPSPPSQPAPTRRPDELFAANVPVISGSIPGNGRAEGSGFDLGETTPIFEEIASAWFRSNRPVPVNWETDGREEPAPPVRAPRPAAAPPAPVRRPVPPVAEPHVSVPPPLAVPQVTAPPVAAPQMRPPAPVDVPSVMPLVEASADRPEVQAPVEPAAFATSADEGWRAASGMEADGGDEVTAAGLPKRRPRARLVPGSAGSAVLAPPATSMRSAETVRGRLASYQQGVRQGRESRMRGGETGSDADDARSKPASARGHDEELS